MLGALPLVGIGVLPSTAPWLRTLLHSVGGGIVGAAYVAWPVWLFAAGRQLRRPARSGRA